MTEAADLFASSDPAAPRTAAEMPVPGARGTNQFRLTIPGEPIAKGRGRIVKRGRHMAIKTPDETRRYEDRVRQIAVRDWGHTNPLGDVAITLDVLVYRGIAPSWSKVRQRAALAGDVRPTGRPDADNFAKAILDGLNGVVLHDDSLVVDLRVRKLYAAEPRCEVEITW